MSHNGIDLDQYILLIIYPSIAFFAIGFISKKIDLRKTITYALQAIICFGFSIGYYILIPYGGALGLSLILGIFGILLVILARKEKVSPVSTDLEEGRGGEEKEEKGEGMKRKEKDNSF
jgi:asparagine N-glycosylation enzyme membrane subunit Stt3